jgi:hypothetical protein
MGRHRSYPNYNHPPTSNSVRITKVIDLTEWIEDQIMGWSIEERTRWEGEGGFIPGESPDRLRKYT